MSMKRKLIKSAARIRLDTYKIIDSTIENAIRYGYVRAHKHIENPSENHMIQEIHHAVMNDLCDILKFDDE